MCFPACSTVNQPKGPMTPSAALDNYNRKILYRPDGSLLDVYVSRPPLKESAPLVFICQGSGYASMFEALPHGDYLDTMGWIWGIAPWNLEIRFAFVEKRGVLFGSPFLDPEADDLPREFLEHDTIKERVDDVCLALKWVLEDPLVDKSKVALLGHGEGAAVAASAAVRCPGVTHLGYLAAGGRQRIVDLVELKRRDLEKKAAEDEDVDPGSIEEAMDELFEEMTEVLENPFAVDSLHFGVTPLQFTSNYFHEPLYDLLKLDIPIFFAFGTADSFIPLASTDEVRLSFLHLGKDNLLFKYYEGLDHGFMGPNPERPESGEEFQYPKVFHDFCRWFLPSVPTR